jgi:hypothetical protein
MTLSQFLRYLCFTGIALVVSGIFCPILHAQTLLASSHMDAPAPAVEPVSPVIFRPVAVTPAVVKPTIKSDEHKFWDTQNSALFLATAALNGADFAVTRANLQSGGQELNPLVRPFGTSTAGLAVNFIGETAGVITLSYFFHKTGHHKLERAVSLFDIGGSAGAVAFGLTHR